MRNLIRKFRRGSHLFTLMLPMAAISASVIVADSANAADTAKPFAKSVTMPIAGDDFPDELAQQKFIESTFKNVKAVHIFICQHVQVGQLPEWLEPEALVAETRKYISDGAHPIEYADHQQHEPDVRECKYDPVLEEAGNLNFIIKSSVSRMPVDGHEIPFFTISRTIYRPDHRTSIQGFLETWPLIVPLTDEQRAKKIEQSHLIFWGIGYSDEPEFNK